MSDNPIITAATEQTYATRSGYRGSGLLVGAMDLHTHISNGDWCQASVQGLLNGSSLLGYVGAENPHQKLLSMGIGWAIEFVEPVRRMLDVVTGDQEHLSVMAKTWNGVSTHLDRAANDLELAYLSDTDRWSGQAVAAYREYCAGRVELFRASAVTAASQSTLIELCATALGMVRSVVRGLFSDFLARVIMIAIRSLPPTPLAVGELATTARAAMTEIGQWIRWLEESFAGAMREFVNSGTIIQQLMSGLGKSVVPTVASGAARVMDE